MEKREKSNGEKSKRSHQTNSNDFNDKHPATFKIHPDDMQFLSEDFDGDWEEESPQSVEAEEAVSDREDPGEAFEQKVLKGLEILEQIKRDILKG